MEIAYIKCGDYYIPDLTLPEEPRPIGKWGRMHRCLLNTTDAADGLPSENIR